MPYRHSRKARSWRSKASPPRCSPLHQVEEPGVHGGKFHHVEAAIDSLKEEPSCATTFGRKAHASAFL